MVEPALSSDLSLQLGSFWHASTHFSLESAAAWCLFERSFARKRTREGDKRDGDAVLTVFVSKVRSHQHIKQGALER
jgi:hypothetical protein